MKIVLIEDEQLIAEDLIDVLKQVNPDIAIIAHLSSVQEGIDFFSADREIDLIFSDIQLGDGLSFEIFKRYKLTVPVIFCTAYDEYALEAFKANGIDYILKPYSKASISEALERYNNLQAKFVSGIQNFSDSMEVMSQRNASGSTLLVHHREKIIPLKLSEIALAYIRNEMVYLRTFDGANYLVSKSLDELDQTLGDEFYRANRQFIVNRNAVKDVTTFLTRKYSVNLTIPFTEQIMVSKEKMTSFLKWLRQKP